MSSDPETRAVYDARVRELNDIYSGQTTRYKDGLEEGEKIGIEKGRAEERAKAEKEIAEERAKAHAEKIKTAKKMISKGLDIDDIADFTGLSIEEIQAL